MKALKAPSAVAVDVAVTLAFTASVWTATIATDSPQTCAASDINSSRGSRRGWLHSYFSTCSAIVAVVPSTPAAADPAAARYCFKPHPLKAPKAASAIVVVVAVAFALVTAISPAAASTGTHKASATTRIASALVDGPTALIGRTADVVYGHVRTDDVHPAHRALVRVLQHVAVQQLPLPKIRRLEADPTDSSRINAGDCIVNLALLVHFTAPAGRYHHDMIEMLVERVDLGPPDGPLVHLVVGDGVKGDVLVPRNTVDAALGHEYFVGVLAGNVRFSQPAQGSREGWAPPEEVDGLRGGGSTDDSPDRLSPEADRKFTRAVAADDKVGAGGSCKEVGGLGGQGHRGSPDAIVGDLHGLASSNGEAIRDGEGINDGDAEAEPAVSLDVDLRDVLAVGDVSDLGRPEYLQHPLVAGPKRHVGIDAGILLYNEETEGSSSDLASGVPVHVGVVPVRASGMIVRDVPCVVQAFSRADRACGVVRVAGAHDVEAVGVDVGTDGSGVA